MAELSKDILDMLLATGKAIGNPLSVEHGTVPYAIIPSGYKIETLERLIDNDRQDRPNRKRGLTKVLDAASFNTYFALFRDGNSRVFADETQNRILGVLDYHEAGAGGPRWGQHRVELTLRESEEWIRWTGKDGEKQSQMEFSEFIEDAAGDIVSPDAATMLEVARDLSAKTDVDFGSAIRMQNGSVQFKYSEQIKGSFGAGNLDVPERFEISVPVYIGTSRVRVSARLRYRITSGKLTFWYDLYRPDAVEREAFSIIYQTVADALEIVIINGAPA